MLETQNMMDIKEVLLLLFINVLIKKPASSYVNDGGNQNELLTEKLHKPSMKKFKIRKFCSSFKDNIWGVQLAGMQLISKFNKRIRFLLCVIDSFSKYAWVFPLKDKKGVTIANAFQSILNDSKRKPN